MTQTLVVALLVVACSLRAAWILAAGGGAPLRSRARCSTLAAAGALAARLRKHAQAASDGCACDGCDKGARPLGEADAGADDPPITFHRRLPR